MMWLNSTILLSGFLRDFSGSYTITIYVSAGSMLLAVAFSGVSMLLESSTKTKRMGHLRTSHLNS